MQHFLYACACFQSGCLNVTTHKLWAYAKAPNSVWMPWKQPNINGTSESIPLLFLGGCPQTSVPYVRWSSHLAEVLIVVGVWARTNSWNQPLPDVPDRPSVYVFVRRGVIFDPSSGFWLQCDHGEGLRGSARRNGSAATSQKGLWFAVVKTSVVKWLQLWKKKTVGSHPLLAL